KNVLKTKMEEELARAKAVEAEEKVNSTRDIEQAEKAKALGVIEASKNAEREKLAAMAAKIRYEVEASGKKALNEAENLRSDASRRSALRLKLAEKIEGIIREWVKPMQNIDSIKVVDVNGLPGFSQGGSSSGDGSGSEGSSASYGGDSKKGSLADNVVNSALRYRAQQPFLDSLLKEIGMSPGEASNIRNILGDYEDPKKDKHMRFDEDTKKNPKKK
ncbi:flotillin family protein, partial [bacterium]|nr:flotillin family protein [bacterium]